jgi:nucleoside-diphosphate-sugar epimerase
MLTSLLAGKVVLVTGATGFLGSHLCRRLSVDGATVYAVARHVQEAEPLRNTHWLEADFSQITAARDLLRSTQPEIVIHLASHVSGARSLEAVLPTFHNNLLTTVNLLTTATEIGCGRLVLAGSLEEPDPFIPNTVPCSPYAAAKWASSTYARMFHTLFSSPVVIARIFMVYGPGQRDLRKLIPYVITSLMQHQPLMLTSGKRLVDFIFIDDVIDGLVAAMTTPGIEGLTFDFGSGRKTSVRSVVERLVELVDPTAMPNFGALAERPLERIRVANVTQGHQALEWEPQVTLLEGLKRTVAWYREQIRTGLCVAYQGAYLPS